MTEQRSLLQRFTTVAGQAGSILNALDIDMLDSGQLKLVGTIKRLLADTRLDIRDWEMSESREEMQENAQEALKRLEQARASILLASEHGMFSAIDIAELTALFDHIAAELRR
jgi:hypothetical protein